MKKFALIALVFVLVLSLTACGRNNDTTQDNNQTPSTDIVPDVMPDDSTNIPDPEVNGNSTNDNSGNDMVTDDNGATTNNGTGTTDNGTTGTTADNGMTGNDTTANTK